MHKNFAPNFNATYLFLYDLDLWLY